ncbi:bifunctional DNA-formamidopyrimidine glycosylase/DNA-(apurinic or apyrimidinic site) lyase [Roseomonas elaeocarpi]|uniref:Formamidopyrimidine-DNA glycosylase n=1 Tax=Roseomonas elaeocarpi TaxID=907779 RepID=A0ABV6JMM7_9PROT
MRGLSAVLTGQVIARAETRRAGLRWPFPDNLAERLQGNRVEGFRRRGKYMLMRLSSGQSMLIHLGMSGRMVARMAEAAPGEALVLDATEGVLAGGGVGAAGDAPAGHGANGQAVPQAGGGGDSEDSTGMAEAGGLARGGAGGLPADPAGDAAAGGSLGPQGRASDARGSTGEKHEHLILETGDGWRVGFCDPRRFGVVDLVPTEAEDRHRLLAGMGPEPLEDDFTPAVLSAALRGRNTPIKAALLDQKVVAGLGNIYVAEALFRAGISPERLAATVVGARAKRLVPAIKAVLLDSIEAGGSSLRDYVRADGEVGFFQDRFGVYDREGVACPACPGPPKCSGVARIVQAGRSTFFCPRTQR